LNRAIALAQVNGPECGIEEINAIEESDRLQSYPFFPAALAELELRAGQLENARRHFEAALAFTRNPMERRYLESRARAAGG
jgi:predicted RNA polymerase sigma factor